MSFKVVIDREPDIVLEFPIAVPSKKNAYIPKAGRFIKNSKVRNFEQAASYCIPNEYRGLMLEHCDMVFNISMPKTSWRGDKDNKITAIMDILVKEKVLKDDSVNAQNGTVISMPVVLSKDYLTIVKIWKK